MRVALLGYGGMGKIVGRIAKERGHEIAVIVDPSDPEATVPNLSVEALSNVDIAIDFSAANALMENLEICLEAGVNLLVGSTGWYEKMEEVKNLVEGGRNGDSDSDSAQNSGHDDKENLAKIGFLWSSNFSIGVNLYFKMVEVAAKMIDKFDEYDIWGHEIHHYNKADSPSGTAKTLEKILLANVKRKTSIVEEKLDRRREPSEIHFSSLRGGLVNFGHTIGFDSAADRILITHEARCRDGYALGALKASEWLVGKRGFFGMEDFWGDLFNRSNLPVGDEQNMHASGNQ